MGLTPSAAKSSRKRTPAVPDLPSATALEQPAQLRHDDVERLVGVVAMHVVFLARLIIMHPGVKAFGVEDLFAPLASLREIFRVLQHPDHFDLK